MAEAASTARRKDVASDPMDRIPGLVASDEVAWSRHVSHSESTNAMSGAIVVPVPQGQLRPG